MVRIKKISVGVLIVLVLLSTAVFIFNKSNTVNAANDKNYERINTDNLTGTFKEKINGKDINITAGIFKHEISSNKNYLDGKEIGDNNTAFKMVGEFTDINGSSKNKIFMIKDASENNTFYLINYKSLQKQDGLNGDIVTGRIKNADSNGITLEDGSKFSKSQIINVVFCEDKEKHKYEKADFPVNTLVSAIISKDSKKTITIIRYLIIQN